MSELEKRINIPWSSNKPAYPTIFSKFWKWLSTPQPYGITPYGTSYKVYGSTSKESTGNTAISEGLMRSNTAISEGLMRDNTAVSQVFNTPQTETNDIVLRNPSKISENPVEGKDQAKRNAPPVNDSKIIESYEKDPYDDLILSEKAKENYENWLRSRHRESGKNNWESFKTRFSQFINNPDLWATGRLAVNLGYNDRIYDEYLKGLSPVLKQSYNTYRQVFGDEATKQGYYTRAAQLQTRASRPFTSNAETSLAAMFDAYAKGNEMRAEGDRADNQRIRETSELANQHLDANRQRATEVANYNIASMAQTKAQKHALLAQKLSAEGSSIDNWLQGIEYRKRQKNARLDAINDQIFALDEQERLSNDEDYLKAYNRWETWKSKHKTESGIVDSSHPDYLKEKKLYTNAVIQRQRKSLRRMQAYKANGTTDFDDFIYAKSGTKITHKEKDDLLYKSAKDVVEHFRKMIALDKKSSKSKNKIERLAPHPKGSTRKYQQGGVAPFLVYKPIALGGESTTSVSTDTSSTKSKNSEGKDTLDLVKSMFEKMLGKGLPVDVNSIYAQMTDLLSNYESFGSSLDTGDIALMYLQSMQRVNNAMYSKELYDKAKEYATKNEALNEFAVDAIGNFIVQDKDGKLSTAKSWKEALTGGKTPITNQQLLYLRAYDPKLASQAGDRLIENVINNGMGINKIGAQIKALAGNIGSSEGKIDGLTQVESNKVKSGLQLLANAPDGYYKHTIEDKNQRAQIRAAISYITGMLSPSQKAILETHGGAETLIPMFLASQENETYNVSIHPLTGKASDNKDSTEKINSNPLISLQREIGGTPIKYNIITRDSNTRMSVNGTSYSSLPKVKEDMSVDKMLSTSGIDGIVTSKYGITFGDQQVDPSNLKDIMYSNTGGVVVTLPCKIVNGTKQVNLDVREAYERAESRALQVSQDRQSQQFIKALGKELEKEHLDSLLDSNGLPNKNMFQQFLVVEGYTTDRIGLKKDSQYIEKVSSPDSNLEDRISKALSTDSKKSDYSIDVDDHWGFLEGHWDDVYRGTVFIPLSNNVNSAINSWGGSSNIGQSTELEELYQISNKSTNFNNNNYLE